MEKGTLKKETITNWMKQELLPTRHSIIENGIKSTSISFDAKYKESDIFSNEIEIGKITNQKKSGRCWIFAGLNMMRQEIKEKLNLETFELSQSYIMFWDKFEKANYFLQSIIRLGNVSIDDRTFVHIISKPIEDGGQWDMFKNLINKYGVVPKYAMAESFHSSNTADLNRVVITKLRRDAKLLREQMENGASDEKLFEMKEEMMKEIFAILCNSLATPPTSFDFEYRNKDKEYFCDIDLTPNQFYEKYVSLNLDDYVSLIHAPTKDKPFYQTFTVDYLGNVVEGDDVCYVNVEMSALKEATKKQLLDGNGVWFGSDVGHYTDRVEGVMDLGLYDFESVLQTDFSLTKAEKLDYRDSCMNHAMFFVGVHIKDGNIVKWKVENSWGDEPGKEGIFVINDNWFDELTYQVVVNKKYLDEKTLKALETEPIVLKPWDPMGSLAKCK